MASSGWAGGGLVEKAAVSKDFRRKVSGYGLTTAEIVCLVAANLGLAGRRSVSKFPGAKGFPRVPGGVGKRGHRNTGLECGFWSALQNLNADFRRGQRRALLSCSA
jgi:hypothetical protein